MTRATVSLRHPPVAGLEGFPLHVLSGATRLYRVSRAGKGPWWFSSTMEGRFDLASPYGTCYLARDEIAALLEVVAQEIDGGWVSSTFLEVRRIRTLRVPTPRRLADLASRRAARFGVTAEVHTIVPYDKPQAWARALQNDGFAGLLYSLRHDPSVRADGVALFGRSGERRSWRRGRARFIDGKLRARLAAECGIRVLDVPRADQLTYVAP